MIPEFIVGFPENPELMIQTIHKIWGETAKDLRTQEILTNHLIKAEKIKLARANHTIQEHENEDDSSESEYFHKGV